MRLGTKSSDGFFNTLAQKSDKIAKLFQKNIEELTKPTTIKVMLGDTTVTEQTTFDPQEISNLYNGIINKLPRWKTQGITTTNDEDLRRTFVKLEFQAGKYVLLWHLSLQYHALLYYKPDIMVQKIQKELAEIMDNTIDKEKELADLTNDLIRQKLAAMGYNEPDEQKLFEVLFNDDKLREEIAAEIDKKMDFDFKAKDQRKKELFRELDNLLIETYQTTSVLIDENRLIAGEEGCVCTFDLDHIKNKSRHAIFEPKRIPNEVKSEMSNALDEVIGILSV
ncbi:MAG: hypothetical protein QXX85_02820 [Candidatus Nitrosotenuis sp.]